LRDKDLGAFVLETLDWRFSILRRQHVSAPLLFASLNLLGGGRQRAVILFEEDAPLLVQRSLPPVQEVQLLAEQGHIFFQEINVIRRLQANAFLNLRLLWSGVGGTFVFSSGGGSSRNS
jgi:hypothetical protein